MENKSRKNVFTSSRTPAPPKSKKGTSVESQSRFKRSIHGSTSRTSASTKRTAPIQSEKINVNSKSDLVQVIDVDGANVTPQPLLTIDTSVVRKNQTNILADSSGGTPTDLMSQASIYQTGTVTASTFGGGLFTRSVFSASQSGRSGSIADDIAEPAASELASAWAEIQHRREEVKEYLTDADLEKEVTINLTETETIWLLDLPCICVSNEGDEALSVKEQNERYQELVKSRVGNDRYAERGMNTFNEPPKLKSVQTTKIGYSEMGVMATPSDMYDTYDKIDNQKKAEDDTEDLMDEFSKVDDDEVVGDDDDTIQMASIEKLESTGSKAQLESLESRGTQNSQNSLDAGMTDSVLLTNENEATPFETIMKSEELQRDLVIMERVVNMIQYQPRLAKYRGLEPVEDIDQEEDEDAQQAKVLLGSDLSPNLDLLWSYVCPLSKGRNIACIAWNRLNDDLLAVAYGQFEFTNQKPGLVCCWSLKNPEYPERVYTCAAGVTSLDFSNAHPNLLAVGMYDGSVAIYDVRSRKNEPVLDSLESTGKHTGPVWQLRWVEKERGQGEEGIEVLVSISQDGRVTQWSIRKGFESSDLNKLKRIQGKMQYTTKIKKAEAFISRFAGGLCFDFSPKDSNIYLAGTEDGHIHRCSCSYNEQYLDSFSSHTGPVYALQWSPFCPDVFLSCSGDWSLKMWQVDRTEPILTFHSSTKSVPALCWSPKSSTVFACVNEGAVEIWDLSQSTLDPIVISGTMHGTKFSTVTFSKNSDCILVGDNEGKVTVFKLRNMPPVQDKEKENEALQKVIQISLASQLASQRSTKQ